MNVEITKFNFDVYLAIVAKSQKYLLAKVLTYTVFIYFLFIYFNSPHTYIQKIKQDICRRKPEIGELI